MILWIGVTTHPSAEWIARQLTEAYAWAQAPQYIIRDRDGIYGDPLIRRLRAMGIRDRPIAPRSPWQNGHTERLIGSIRRECLDHVVVFGERHLRQLLGSYQRYYNDAVLRCLFPGICLGELTGDPFGSRMSGHAQPHDHATSVLEYQQPI